MASTSQTRSLTSFGLIFGSTLCRSTGQVMGQSNDVSDDVEINAGVRQGCVLSPRLFSAQHSRKQCEVGAMQKKGMVWICRVVCNICWICGLQMTFSCLRKRRTIGTAVGHIDWLFGKRWPTPKCIKHPCVHSAEKLCPLNRLQTQPYTTKWRLNLNQPPLLQSGLGVFMVDQKPMSVTTKWLCVPIL